MEQKEKKKEMKELIITAAYILIVVGFGMLAVNQTLSFFYKAHFLKNPCSLCSELNPNQSKCITGCFQQRIAIYPDGAGGWITQNGTPYNSPAMRSSPNFSLINISIPD